MTTPDVLELDAIGTRWRIDADQPLAPHADGIAALIDAYDRAWSRFRDDSLVARIAREGGAHPLPAAGERLLGLYDALHELTAGAVTPLVGAALEHHGYDAGYALTPRPGPPPAVADWRTAVRWDATTLHADAPVLLDVGAAGKGQLVDLVGALLVERGVASFVVDAGGDLLRRAPAEAGPLRVALEHPGDPSQAIGVVEIGHGALAASAVNRRAWADRHHVLDGRDGRPTGEVVATWAVADEALLADGLATALFFVGPEELATRFPCAGVRLLASGRAEWSSRWPGELFLAGR
ncbi:FAD:protein FMN transferase [Patulibacter brassicae]|uniref:FAD:protein FMN transferase n=1 Tax=Patulibacter brassicae TaxID=1705717 RepID=A0ABU4VJA5_9ACTN|nr:FAD:protein FMN transferase [Patulibacter brassicae]MDX8151006.1 FAD:protein FMN transferase [Patulibacter brassicae]